MPIGNIRQTISKNADSLKEGGAAALGTLILGGSKAEAAMAGVGQAVLTKLVGPLGKVVGITAMATKGIYNMTKAWATMGTSAASKLETVQNQLRVMLKGLDAAKQRVRELRNFSIATPFKMGDIVQGNRALESLTRGALTTKNAMTLVGDAAAQAGVGFEDMAVYVGRLYDGLAGGRPVGEVLFRLAELGVISGTARTAIEQLQESGAGFSEVWRVVEGELKRSAGTMGYTSKTLEGLQSTLDDTQDELKATFSANFLDGQKEAISAQIKTLENLKPAVLGVGRAYGGVVGVLNTFTAKITALLTSIPGAAAALEFFGRMAGVAALGITALGAATGAANLIGMLSKIPAVAMMAGGALGFMGKAARGVAAVLGALVRGPLGLLVGALTIAGTLWYQHKDHIEQAAEALREYESATDSLVSKLEAEAAAVKTLDGLQQNYASTLQALAQAYDDYAEASKMGNDAGANAAATRSELLVANVKRLQGIDPNSLELPADVMGNQISQSSQGRDVADARREMIRSLLRPEQGQDLIASLGEETETLSRRRQEATRMNAGVAGFQQAKSAAGIDVMSAGSRVSAQQAKVAVAKAGLAGNFADYEEYDAAAAALKKLTDELDRLKQAEAEALAAELKLAQGFDNQIVQIQAGLSVYSRYQAAVQGVFAARVAASEASKAGEGEKEALAAVKEQEEQVRRLQVAYDALGWSAQDAQRKQLELAQVKERMARDMQNSPEQVAREQQLAEAKRAEQEKQARMMGVRGGEVADRLRLGAQGQRLSGRGDAARRLEELAAVKEELASSQARVNELRGQGFGEDEALRMVTSQNQRNQLGRGMDREGGLLQALLGKGQVVDSMQRIGGGGGIGAGPDLKKVIDRLDKLIRAVEQSGGQDMRL